MKAPLPAWHELDSEATRLRREVGERLRQWGAVLHARGRHRGLPSRWLAAFDSTQRPYRSRLAQIDNTSTDRDHAEAAAPQTTTVCAMKKAPQLTCACIPHP